MIKSTEVYTPQVFLEKLTGKTYIYGLEDDRDFLRHFTTKLGLNDYELDEITNVNLEEVDVVLVRCLDFTGGNREDYIWFEVPYEFEI